MPFPMGIPINKTGSSNKFPLSYEAKVAILKGKIPKLIAKKIRFALSVCECIRKKTKIKPHFCQMRSGASDGFFLGKQFLKYSSVLPESIIHIPYIIIPITVLFVVESISAGIGTELLIYSSCNYFPAFSA